MKALHPGDIVIGLDNMVQFRPGIIVAVNYDRSARHKHLGCEYRLLVLWSDTTEILVEECDCGIMLPSALGL